MTRSRAAVKETLIALVSEITGIPTDRITDEATIDDELQMQSVAFVELQVAIEDELNVRLDPIQIIELNQFGAIVDYVYETAVEAAA